MHILTLLVFSVSTLMQDPAGGTADKQTIESTLVQLRTATEIAGNTTLHDAFARTLYGSGLSGGVASVVSGCQIPAKPIHIPQGMKLPTALDAVVTDGSHQWTAGKNIILLLPTEGMPKLLQTRIQKLHITDQNNLDLALSEIIQVKEIRDSASALSLTLVQAEPGFRKLTGPQSAYPKGPIDFQNATVADILNALASGRAGIVWSYTELHCDGHISAHLDFISK